MGSAYRKITALVTGGLGFIGSALALRLVRLGARVIVVDSSVAGCGANPHNLQGVSDLVRFIPRDIADANKFGEEIAASSVIFNLAGEISHINSMNSPLRDAELNALAQLHFLEACSRLNPGVRVVYASTRQIYGVPRYLPVDENHPIQPVDFNGIHKYAATAYHQVAASAGRLDARVLCLSNVYGPRMALNVPGQGFLAHFIRKALLGETIEVFGDGRQLRDPVFVEDVVDAFLLAGAIQNPVSRLWNVGGGEPISLGEIARTIAAAASAPKPEFRPFPPELKRIDIGSYTTDFRRLQSEAGWGPSVDLRQGVQQTIEFYREQLPHYLPGVVAAPASSESAWIAPAPEPVAL